MVGISTTELGFKSNSYAFLTKGFRLVVLEEVIIADLDGNKKILNSDILLPFFGLAQNLGPILDFGLNISNHHIEVNYPYFETNVKGIYAVGDVAKYEGKLKLNNIFW